MFTFQDVFTEHSYTKTTSRNQILTMLTIINKNTRNHQSKEYQLLQKIHISCCVRHYGGLFVQTNQNETLTTFIINVLF